MAVRNAQTRSGVAFTAAASALVLVTFVVALLPAAVSRADLRLGNEIAEWRIPAFLNDAATLRRTGAVLVVALFAIIIGHRCLVYTATYLASVGAVFLVGFALEDLVGRDRPLGVVLTGTTTFPCMAVAQVVVIAGLLPLGIETATRQRKVGAIATVLLAGLALAAAVVEVHDRHFWPTDVLGGVLLGLAAVFAGHWVLAHRGWHRACSGCPWSPGVGAHERAGLVVVCESRARVLRRGAIAWTLVLLALFSAVTLSAGVPEAPEGSMLDTISGPLQIALVALMLVGAAVAAPWPVAGATMLMLSGVALAVLSVTAFAPGVAIVIATIVLVPGVAMWLSWQRTASPTRIWAAALTTTALLTAGFFVAARIYDDYYGPTHPSSALPLLPVDRVEWAWSGGVEPTRGTVAARMRDGTGRARLAMTDAEGREAFGPPVAVPDDRIVKLRTGPLAPGTRYRWRVVVDGHPDRSRGHGSFRTPLPGAQSLAIVAGSCARTGSNGRVWDAMRATHPDLVLLTGDLHYQNIDANDVDAFRAAYDRVLTQPAPAALFRAAPVAYLWDDHDYGPNDADITSPSRPAARAAYRESVPHSPLGPSGPPAQAFTVGEVRVIVTDERSNRTPHSMLGRRQLTWFLDELKRAGASHRLVVWVNSVPWIGRARSGGDSWAGYPDDRRLIADTIARAGIRNLVMVAGDAHMVAIDDGSHSDYSTSGGGGFPILHAAALDRPGSIKGGPYSEGAVAGGGQFGLLRIHDDGTNLSVVLEGRDWTGRRLLRYRFVPS